ncbi:MAG: YlbF family regulator [Bacilli bacterium]|nr:YlbF family regulator [Bacilli bacterium]
MNIEIINKLDEIIELFKNDKEYNKMLELSNKLSNNKELLDKINKIKDYKSYDDKYIELKKDVINNSDYKEYKELEKDYYLFIREINRKLNSLKEKSDGCENH